jgi:galactoside O-acetyltransferase
MSNSFYTLDELTNMGFKSIGNDVLISRKASIYNADVITIGNSVRIDDFCIISGGCGIEIGNYIHISAYVALYGGSGIVISDFVALSARITVFSESDDYSGASLTNPMIPDKYKPGVKKGRVYIGRHVIVGVNSTILPGVTLGDGVAVGAHSLVSKSCEPWSIYFGCPAKRLKDRKKDLLELEKQFLKSE